MNLPHNFHIPVMGICFTIDTPIKVAPYGISSVISIIDDVVIEKMREFYHKKFNIPFISIPYQSKDYRAKRITSYLNLIQDIVAKKFEELKNSINTKSKEFEKYISMLPDSSLLKQKIEQAKKMKTNLKDIWNWIKENLLVGNIDVNIMTKLDKDNFHNHEKLPIEFNDAHAALRGFAESKLDSSLVLSAGMNARLYSYIEKFDDFYPDENGYLKKKIILKVSDYRSALIQGKFLAKKGLWISEYRVESPLNCGGHAFISEGLLLGPILEEFKKNRCELISQNHEIYSEALKTKKRYFPKNPLPVKFSAQGGVSTAEEHSFLLDNYQLDSIGWGTPFLLVPEVTNVDEETLELLKNANEDELYLSGVSPLGIPFANIRGNSKDVRKMKYVEAGTPGSICTKRYSISNTEFTKQAVCIASKEYQTAKIRELKSKNLSPVDYENEFNKIIDKTCLCEGLAQSVLIKNGIADKDKSDGVIICPGPNLTNFSKVVQLEEMVGHIYGRNNVIDSCKLPNLFIKELKLYLEYLKQLLNEYIKPISAKQKDILLNIKNNITSGIEYYKNLSSKFHSNYATLKDNFFENLNIIEYKLEQLFTEISLLDN